MNGTKIYCFKAVNKRGIIEKFYNEESETWHREVHKNRGGVRENIESTLESISPESVMYEVVSGVELAAFFVVYSGQVLEGFHIRKKFRNADFLSSFWKAVRGRFSDGVLTGICSTNEAAIKHLIKQGFDVIDKVTEKNQLFFILKSK